MNTQEVEKLVAKNQVVAIKADKTRGNPEIDALLKELGNPGAVIPFLAIFPGDGGETITFDGPIRQQSLLDALEQAGPSSDGQQREAADSSRAESLLAR